MPEQTSTIDRLINIGLAVAGVGTAWYFINRSIENANSDRASSQLMDNPMVQQATRLRNAFNPSGMSWLINTDGTTNSEVFEVAKSITDFKALQKAYSDLYKGDNLADDLRRELSTSEYSRFIAMASQSKRVVSKTSNTSNCSSFVPQSAKYRFKGNDILLPAGVKANTYKQEGGKYVQIASVPSGTIIGKVVGQITLNKVNKNCTLASQTVMYKVETLRTRTAAGGKVVYVNENDVIAR